MSDRMRVVATWLEEDGCRSVMRDDGQSFSWSPRAGEWLAGFPDKAAPGCEASETRPGSVPLNVTEPELSLIADAVHRYRSSASGALRDQLDRLWRSLVS